jgi:hypothetical protein
MSARRALKSSRHFCETKIAYLLPVKKDGSVLQRSNLRRRAPVAFSSIQVHFLCLLAVVGNNRALISISFANWLHSSGISSFVGKRKRFCNSSALINPSIMFSMSQCGLSLTCLRSARVKQSASQCKFGSNGSYKILVSAKWIKSMSPSTVVPIYSVLQRSRLLREYSLECPVNDGFSPEQRELNFSPTLPHNCQRRQNPDKKWQLGNVKWVK